MSDDSPTLRQMLLMLYADDIGAHALHLDLPESLHLLALHYEHALAVLGGKSASRRHALAVFGGKSASRQIAALIYTMWARQEAMRDE